MLRVTAGERDLLPRGICPGGPGLPVALALPLAGCGAVRALASWPRPLVRRGIPSQARDHDHLAFDTRQQQRDRGKAAIDDHHPPLPRQPTAHVGDHVPVPSHAGLMLSAVLGSSAGGGCVCAWECCTGVSRLDDVPLMHTRAASAGRSTAGPYVTRLARQARRRAGSAGTGGLAR